MTSKVFIEEHLDKHLKSLVKGNLFIPGVIIGQVIDNNYYIVHLSAISILDEPERKDNELVLTYKTVSDLLADSDTIFQKSLIAVNLLPGGSHILGLFFIVPQDLKSIQPINIDFYEYSRQLNENLLYKKTNEKWNYLLLNYSTVNQKSYCYSVDFNRVNGPEKTTYKAIDQVFGSYDNDWVNLIGTFNFGALDRINVAGGPKDLTSIFDSLLDTFESVLNKSVYTFNGYVCDEKKLLRELKCDKINNLLKNVIKIEFYREVDLGNKCKNAYLEVERGKGKILISGLCHIAVPFNRNGTIKDAIKAIYDDAMQTFAIRLKLHLESMVEEESLDEEDGDTNIVHETPRRVLIFKTEGSRYAFSDYVFPGETSQEILGVARDILNLPVEKMELYDVLEKGGHVHYETLPDVDSSPPQAAASTSTSNNMLAYLAWAALILAILAYGIRHNFA